MFDSPYSEARGTILLPPFSIQIAHSVGWLTDEGFHPWVLSRSVERWKSCGSWMGTSVSPLDSVTLRLTVAELRCSCCGRSMNKHYPPLGSTQSCWRPAFTSRADG